MGSEMCIRDSLCVEVGVVARRHILIRESWTRTVLPRGKWRCVELELEVDVHEPRRRACDGLSERAVDLCLER